MTVPKEVPETEEGDFKLYSSARVPGLTKMVLRSRTPFAAFLCTTFHLHRSDVPATSPLFPVPMPAEGIFDRMPSGLSLRARRRIHLRRAVHVMVMALNYWHGGLRIFPNEQLLTRRPSMVHIKIYQRLKGMLVADGSGAGSFEMLVSGRKFPQ